MSRSIDREVHGADWRLWPTQVRGGNWSKIFGEPRDAPMQLNVDVGFGRGEFLLELARRDPKGAYVGVELDFARVLKLARRLSDSSIRNVRLIGISAEWAIREAFSDASVSSFWINFPDPWPKRRHWRRRIVAPRLVAEMTKKLVPGGSVFVATDDHAYAGVIHEVLTRARGLDNALAPAAYCNRRSNAPRTAFEQAWQVSGRRCRYFQYTRKMRSER